VSETHARGWTIRYPGPAALFLIWTVIAALAYARHYLQGIEAGQHPQIWPECLHWVACFYPWALLAPVVFRLEKRFPLAPRAWRRHLPVLALAGAVLAYVAGLAAFGFGLAIRLVLREPLAGLLAEWAPSSRELWLQFTLFACTAAASFLIRRFMEFQEQEVRNAQLALEKSRLETNLKEAELEALRMRLNPHFLFNTLQNISVLARQEPKTASQMLARLGDLLRVALKRDPRHEIPLEEEAGITESYLAVEKMRFRDRLTVRFDLAPGTERALVPSLLLQPLVENAILHGLRGRAGGSIEVASRREDGQLVLTVTDNGGGPPDQDLAMGTGLSSTCERLARLYPAGHELSMRKTEDGGTEVRVAFPFRAPAEPGLPDEQPAAVDCR
jgi:two-component system LytT family sensor kinase